MVKNYPFYIVLRYAVTFTNANPTVNEDLLQTLHKELNCEHPQDLSTMYRNFVVSYLYCHIFLIYCNSNLFLVQMYITVMTLEVTRTAMLLTPNGTAGALSLKCKTIAYVYS